MGEQLTKTFILFTFITTLFIVDRVKAEAMILGVGPMQIPRSEYSFRLKEAFQKVHQKLIEALKQKPGVTAPGGPNSWRLSTIGVGISVGLEAKFGKLASVEGAPSFQLLYTRDKIPVYP